jgi:SAM-dependent methyltransferase
MRLGAAKRWLVSVASWARPLNDVPPPKRLVRFGSLRRLSPISREWGFDRGTPIDRHYIEHFLSRYAGRAGYALGDIRGHVLEVEWDFYSRRFGGWGEPDSAVERLDILHADESNPDATIVADLVNGGAIPSDTFDCVICTQTLQFIYDVEAALRTLHRILKPGGVLLATVSGISQTAQPDIDLWGDYWRFTTRSARELFGEVFPAEGTRVEAYGNVLTATAFLYGIAAEELRSGELAVHDPQYQVLIAIRAVKEDVG